MNYESSGRLDALLNVVVLTMLFGISACSERSSSPEASQHRLIVPNGLADVTLDQRSTVPLPGSDGLILLTIGDITDGQVIASISTAEGKSVLAPVSVSVNESAAFALDDHEYTLTVKEFRNQVVGTDTAVFTLAEGTAGTEKLTEGEKIERLIEAVAGLQDAVFIRNDKEHTSTEAAKHLRDKWQWKADEIATAEDFIRVAGTRSSITGKPYVIRFPDGREVPSAEFLFNQLKTIVPAR